MMFLQRFDSQDLSWTMVETKIYIYCV